jgi:long-chain-fatty-acid--CoA ligase ACSBG
MDAAARLPKLKAIIIWDPLDKDAFNDFTVPAAEGEEASGRVVRCVHWRELASIVEGSEVTQEVLEGKMDALDPGGACAYIYTSGTTGRPKAVMISHDNILFESSNVLQLIPQCGGMEEGEERIISFLPLSHVAGLMVDIVAPLAMTAQGPGWASVFFARPYDLKIGSVGDRLKAVKPTMFLGVPRVWEKIAEKIMASSAKVTGLKKTIGKWAKSKGLEHQKNCSMGGNGQKPSFYGLAESLALSKIKAALGLECCKFGFTGAAPITTDTLEFFGAFGIQINEVYGMSECTGATTWSTDEAHVWGSCGWPMPGNEVRICKPVEGKPGEFLDCPKAEDIFNPTEEVQGEICFRGRHIMLGYMANPDLGEEHVAEIQKKNQEAIDSEGWLHSGDKVQTANGIVIVCERTALTRSIEHCNMPYTSSTHTNSQSI